MHPKVLGLTLEPKLTSTTSQYTHINLYKSYKHSLQQDGLNKRKHSWLLTRQLFDRLWSIRLPYGCFLHPQPALIICKSCRTTTGCTQDTHTQHLHDEILTLLIHGHLQLYASQYKHKLSITSLTQQDVTLQG